MYGNLSEAALLAKAEALLTIFHVGETLRGSSGSNGIAKMTLINELVVLGIFSSRAHIRKLLETGNGTFWGLGGNRVWLRSLGHVAQALGARSSNAHRQLVNTRDLQTAALRRGTLLGAALPADRPISQRAIRRQTGKSERSQSRYRRAGCFAAVRQDADITSISPSSSPWVLRIVQRDLRAHGAYIGGGRLMKRIANRYVSKGTRIQRGRRSKAIFAARPLKMLAGGDRAVPRVFFDRIVGWTRCKGLKLGSPAAQAFADPLNVAYARVGANRWEAVSC